MSSVPNPFNAMRRVLPRTGQNPVPNAGALQQQSNTSALQRPPAQPAVAARPGPQPLAAPVAPQAPAAPFTAPGPGVQKPVASPVTQAPGAAAPAAAPAQAPYGAGGGTSAQSGSLEDQLRNYFTQTMSGATSQDFINRARGQLGAATEGQRAQAVNRVNEDAIGRGLFRSGIASDQAAAAGRSAQGAFASGLQDILQNAEQQNMQARQGAAQGLQGLLESNRGYDQYQQQRADSMRGGGGGGPQTFRYIDPDTGEDYGEIPIDMAGDF